MAKKKKANISKKDELAFAERLKKLREEIDASQTEIGKIVGYPQTTIWRYEHGLSFPPFKVLMAYAEYFNVSLDWLFGRTPHREGKLYSGVSKVEQEHISKAASELLSDETPAGKKLREVIKQIVEADKAAE